MESADVIIIGGGLAGLSAALYFGRATLRTVIIDAQHPRNEAIKRTHGFFTHEGTPPGELYRIAREQLKAYGTITFVDDVVCKAVKLKAFAGILPNEGKSKSDQGVKPLSFFEIGTVKGLSYHCSRILLASGVVDYLPNIPGLQAMWGTSILNCPSCQSFEVAGQPAALLSSDRRILEDYAPLLYNWHKDLVVLTHGPAKDLGSSVRSRFANRKLKVIEERIARFQHDSAGRLTKIEFEDGTTLDRSIVYAPGVPALLGDIHVQLGCDLTTQGFIKTGPSFETTVTGVYAAGDCLGINPPQQLVSAAFTGSMAAICLCQDLLTEQFLFKKL